MTDGPTIPPLIAPGPPAGDPCGKCGDHPAAHAGWAKGHLWIRRMAYQDKPAEVQPHRADATADDSCRPAIHVNRCTGPDCEGHDE